MVLLVLVVNENGSESASQGPILAVIENGSESVLEGPFLAVIENGSGSAWPILAVI